MMQQIRDQFAAVYADLVSSIIAWTPRILMGIVLVVAALVVARVIERVLRSIMVRVHFDALAPAASDHDLFRERKGSFFRGSGIVDQMRHATQLTLHRIIESMSTRRLGTAERSRTSLGAYRAIAGVTGQPPSMTSATRSISATRCARISAMASRLSRCPSARRIPRFLTSTLRTTRRSL